MTNTKNPKHADSLNRCPLYLCPPVALVHMAAVLAEGASRPGRWPYNWRDEPVNQSEYLSAPMRHLLKMMDGEWIDAKSGKPHAACIMANMGILLDAEACGTLIDDLPKVKSGVAAHLEAYETASKARQAVVAAVVPAELSKEELSLKILTEHTTRYTGDCGSYLCLDVECLSTRLGKAKDSGLDTKDITVYDLQNAALGKQKE